MCMYCFYEVISGLRFGVYWLATFMWDLVVLYAFFASLLILLVVLKVRTNSISLQVPLCISPPPF